MRAAGGVVRRVGVDGPELLLVHRPRYDDWSFPKGKAERGETPAETARREVFEETGYACAVGPEVAAIRYVDHRGRSKEVRYFVMRVEQGEFVVNDEVDQVAWCAPEVAATRLSYPHDHDVLVAAAAVTW